MPNQYNYVLSDADGALYQVLPKDMACAEWGTAGVAGSHALGVFNAGGDGIIIDGSPEDVLRFVDLLHDHAHAVLGGAGQ